MSLVIDKEQHGQKPYLTIDDVNVTGKYVLVRGDMNVPMKDGLVTDTTRLKALVPTLENLTHRGAKVIVMSHFGRPKGQCLPDMSLQPVALKLAEILGEHVTFIDKIPTTRPEMTDGQIVVIENLRFNAGEEENDPAFAQSLASLGDLYVNDAFSAAHRAHASTEGITYYLPSVAGYLMDKELSALQDALEKPVRPVLAVVGGAKISTKISVLENLVQKVDFLVLGGGMANTFLLAGGQQIGGSLAEHDMVQTAQKITQKASACGCQIILPSDARVAKKLEKDIPYRDVALDQIEQDDMILDLGPDSIAQICSYIDKAQTVLWNGPLGVFEVQPFDQGTCDVAAHVAHRDVLSVAGGGDTIAALSHAGVDHRFSYISTAGGAFLEWLEGKDLPGVAALIGSKK